MISKNTDQQWMRIAIEEATKSALSEEVPVGAVIALNNKLLAAGGNCPISAIDPTAHAEINAIRKAASILGNYRLPGTTLYVTLEPCLMCMGAIVHARIERLVFGAFDPKTGAAFSKYRIGTDNLLNHTLEIEGGILAPECGKLLKEFFRHKRG